VALGTSPGWRPWRAGISDSPWGVAKFALTTNSDPLEKGGKQDLAAGWNQPIAISLTDPIKVSGNVIRIPSGDERARILLSNLEPDYTVLLD
jgi:hypothetical protein